MANRFTPVTDPKLLEILNSSKTPSDMHPQQKAQFAPYGTGVLGQVASGVSNVGREFDNNLVNLSNAIMHGISYGASKISGHNINIPEARKLPLEAPRTIGGQTGALTGDLAASAAEFGPVGEAAGAAAGVGTMPKLAQVLTKYGAMSGLGAAEDPKNMGEGAAMGAAMPLAGAGISRAVTPVLKPAIRYIAGRTFNPLISKIAQISGESPEANIVPQELGHAYSSAEGTKDILNDKVIESAKDADAVSKFNNSSFLKKAESMIKQLSKNKGYLVPSNQKVISYINNVKAGAPELYSDIPNSNQIINSKPINWDITDSPSNSLLKIHANKLRKALNDSIESNSNGTPEVRNFLNNWHGFNKSYGFYKGFTKLPKGGADPDNFQLYRDINLHRQLESGSPNDTVANNFLPRNRDDKSGILKMAHFSNLIGDEGKAKNMLMGSFIRKASYDGDESEINPLKLFKNYSKLSSDQRNYLFSSNSELHGLLESAIKSKSIDERNRYVNVVRRILNRNVGMGSVSGVVGTAGVLGGALSGHPIESSLPTLLALHGPNLTADYIASKLASKEGLDKIQRGLASRSLLPGTYRNPTLSALLSNQGRRNGN